MRQRQVSTTTYPVTFFMADSADSRTGKTGLTPTVTLSKSGAAFGAAAGAVSEIGSGWYALAGNATDRGTLGDLAIHATASGADPADVVIEIVTHDPFNIASSTPPTANENADALLDRAAAVAGKTPREALVAAYLAAAAPSSGMTAAGGTAVFTEGGKTLQADLDAFGNRSNASHTL